LRYRELAKRNLKEVWRDPLSLGINLALPVVLLVTLNLLEDVEEYFSATMLTPGIVLFGFVMLMLSTAMTLARDRETALFSRLLTTPLRPNDFVAGYSAPYFPVAVLQALLLFAIGAVLGLDVAGSVVLVSVVVLVMAVFYIALGMILGSTLSYRAVPGVYAPILLLTVFGGTWLDPRAIGGVIESVADALPFAHALYAVRGVMVDGARFGEIAADLSWVLGYTAVMVVLAVVLFRRRMVE
jgi:ABC-2 type transport system permease protein